MFWFRSTKLGSRSTIFIVLSLLVFGPAAHANVALSCAYKDSIFNGEVDFGSGHHSLGNPEHDASIGWSFTSLNGSIVVTARLRGRLYLDKVGAGCARLRVNFQDGNFNNIQATTDVPFCGPGNDSNNNQNWRNIDVTSFGSTDLRRVQITLGEGQTLGSIVDLHTGGSLAPSTNLHIGDRVNNGSTDFGGNPHLVCNVICVSAMTVDMVRCRLDNRVISSPKLCNHPRSPRAEKIIPIKNPIDAPKDNAIVSWSQINKSIG